MSLELLLRRVRERDTYQRIGCDRLPELEAVTSHGERAYVGGDYLTLPRSHVKYVLADAAYFPYTAGELARAWLDWVLERAERHKIKHGRLAGGDELGPALFFNPPADRAGSWVMLDVKAAYWTVYSRSQLDCLFGWIGRSIWYKPGQLAIPAEDLAWVETEKPLRNAAFGIMLPGSISYYENGTHRHKPKDGGYVAHGVTQLCYATMHAAALMARHLGAAAWLTDSAICRPEQAEAIDTMLRETFGLHAEVKASGTGRLYGLGDYRIGEHETEGEHTDRPGHDGLAGFRYADVQAISDLGAVPAASR